MHRSWSPTLRFHLRRWLVHRRCSTRWCRCTRVTPLPSRLRVGRSRRWAPLASRSTCQTRARAGIHADQTRAAASIRRRANPDRAVPGADKSVTRPVRTASRLSRCCLNRSLRVCSACPTRATHRRPILRRRLRTTGQQEGASTHRYWDPTRRLGPAKCSCHQVRWSRSAC